MDNVVGSVTATAQPIRVSPKSGTYTWLLQRATAYGLVVFLTVHMLFNHFLDLKTGNNLSFEVVNRRFFLYPVIYAVNDIGLLTCALFHGMNGVRNVIYDLVTNTTARRIATVILVLITLAFLFDGTRTLLALMTMPATASK